MKTLNAPCCMIFAMNMSTATSAGKCQNSFAKAIIHWLELESIYTNSFPDVLHNLSGQQEKNESSSGARCKANMKVLLHDKLVVARASSSKM